MYDPANVVQPVWKSRQGNQGSWVFEGRGLKSSEWCSDNMYSGQDILTGVVQEEEGVSKNEVSTSVSCTDPVNVIQPFWKSSQVKHGSGVFDIGGANSSEDMSRPGVVHEYEGWSSNDTSGIKYCPGGELPKYEYVEYKPRCSKTRRTTFVYMQDKTKPEVQLEQDMDVSWKGWRIGTDSTE